MSVIRIELNKTPTPIKNYVVPNDGIYLQVKHDFETEDWQYKPRSIILNYKKEPPLNPLPDTAYLPGCKPNDFVPLSKEWQFFWFDLLRLASNGTKTQPELLIAWEDLTKQGRAFTDFHSTAYGFTGYVLGINLNSNSPIQHKSISCGGNIVKKVGTDGGKILIKALNLSNPPPKAEDVWGKWHLIHWATQSTIQEISDGAYRVVRFPQLGSWGVPFPLVSLNGINKIDPSWTKPLSGGQVISPYL
jgi:hypothetical protein